MYFYLTMGSFGGNIEAPWLVYGYGIFCMWLDSELAPFEIMDYFTKRDYNLTQLR